MNFQPNLIRVGLCALVFASTATNASLNYSTRSLKYSGYQTSLRGDINTVGMAGANVALPTSISAMENNPAGTAMMMGSLSAQIASNTISDRSIQPASQSLKSNLFGISFSNDGWGLSVGSYEPSNEGEGAYELSVREYHFSASKLYLDKKLSLGMGVILANADLKTGTDSETNSAWGVQVGALLRTSDRWVFGASLRPGFTIGSQSSMTSPPGFFKPVQTPWIFSQGVGWVPNRLFKAGASLVTFGRTQDVGLLRNQNRVGESFVLQPRIGAAYVLADFPNLKLELAMGTYWESSRVAGLQDRYHQTIGLDVNPGIFNTGIGVDRAPGYTNFMLSIGVDLVRTMRAIDLIPPDPVQPQSRFFPNPTQESCRGLPDGMCDEQRQAGEAPPSLEDVQQIILDLPEKIRQKFNSPSSTH